MTRLYRACTVCACDIRWSDAWQTWQHTVTDAVTETHAARPEIAREIDYPEEGPDGDENTRSRRYGAIDLDAS